MSKLGAVDEDIPPPYSPQQAPVLSPPQPSSSPSIFASHLSALQHNLRQNHAAQATARDQVDNQALSLIIPYVEDLLSSIADIQPPPASVEATIIPCGAVEKEWHLTEKDEKLRGEVRTVIRVSDDRKGDGDEKRRTSPPLSADTTGGSSTSRSGFDEWGRWDEPSSSSQHHQSNPWSWWEDGSRARRLAKYLRPPAPVPQRQVIREVVSQKQSKSRWGLFKKDVPTIIPTADIPPPLEPPPSRAADESVTLSTKAEEVTFRRENIMGIWESRTGWGVVITVKIKR